MPLLAWEDLEEQDSKLNEIVFAPVNPHRPSKQLKVHEKKREIQEEKLSEKIKLVDGRTAYIL